VSGTQLSAPASPQLSFETITAFQQTDRASERGIRSLCNTLVVLGFLKKGTPCYSLTQDSAMFLDQRSPAYLGGAIKFLLAPPAVESFQDLAAAVRKGAP
jgi:hypothetical protein